MVNKKYDYLLVGAGLFNAVIANEMMKKGKKCHLCKFLVKFCFKIVANVLV